MHTRRYLSMILWVLTAAWTALVLHLTLQPGPDTAQTSGRLAAWLHQLLTGLGFVMEFDVFHMLLRTAAHFVLFFGFGILFESAMLSSVRRVDFVRVCVPALLAGAAISIIPEVLKLWIPGRHLQWDEVGLNVAGALVGTLGVYGMARICRGARK